MMRSRCGVGCSVRFTRMSPSPSRSSAAPTAAWAAGAGRNTRARGAGDAPRDLRRATPRDGDDDGRPGVALVAARRFRRCRAAAASKPGDQPGHPRRRHANVGSALANLALVVADLGNHAEAETLLREAVVVTDHGAGAAASVAGDHLEQPRVSAPRATQVPEAIAAMDEALALAIPARGDDSPTVATYRINLARVHVARGDGAAAEPLLRRRWRSAARPTATMIGGSAARSLLGAALTSQRHTLTPSGCCSMLSGSSRTSPAPRGARQGEPCPPPGALRGLDAATRALPCRARDACQVLSAQRHRANSLHHCLVRTTNVARLPPAHGAAGETTTV